MSAEEVRRLDALAKRFGQSRSAMIRLAFNEYAEKKSLGDKKP
jgi:predicted transcriptional regulator